MCSSIKLSSFNYEMKTIYEIQFKDPALGKAEVYCDVIFKRVAKNTK